MLLVLNYNYIKNQKIISIQRRSKYILINLNKNFIKNPSIPNINIDPELLVQVFLNIARNAMQSLDEVIIPQLTFVTRVERLFTVGARQHKIVIKVDIIDNGQGIQRRLKSTSFSL